MNVLGIPSARRPGPAVASRLARLLPLLLLVATGLPSPSGSTAPATTTASAPTADGADGRDAGRPNLLMVMVDDMRSDELEWMPHVREWMQQGGVELRNSFSPYPLCCPARASFLSGELAHNHGVLYHESPYGFSAFDDRRTLATSLRGAGYHTMFVGKYLNGYGTMPTRDGAPSMTYVPPGWDSWDAGVETGLPASDPLAGDTYDYFDTTTDADGTVVPHEGDYSTDLYAAKARADLAAAPAGQPWFLYLSLLAPHHGDPVEADDPSPRWLTGTDGVPLPAGYVSPARPDWVKGIVDQRLTKAPGVPLPGRPAEDTRHRPFFLRAWPPLDDVDRASMLTVARQRAEALVVADLQFDRTMRQLRDAGQLDDTVVVFTSDNGYFLGEHNQREGKVKAHEPSLRVPLLVRGPGLTPGVRYDPATTVDLTATLLDYAGAPAPHVADGVSLRPVLEHGDRGWTRPVLTEGLIPRMAPRAANRAWPHLSYVGLRLPRWSYMRYADGSAELYDLWRDPNELRNLHLAPSVREIERAVERVWRRSVGCAGATCRAGLPASLAASVSTEQAVTDHQEHARLARFGGVRPLTAGDVARWRRGA